VYATGLAIVIDTVGIERLGRTLGTLCIIFWLTSGRSYKADHDDSQINSFIAVGELGAPVLGGILYERPGDIGLFGASAGLLAVDLVMRMLVRSSDRKESRSCILCFRPSRPAGTTSRY
jgi:hypothetical protein